MIKYNIKIDNKCFNYFISAYINLKYFDKIKKYLNNNEFILNDYNLAQIINLYIKNNKLNEIINYIELNKNIKLNKYCYTYLFNGCSKENNLKLGKIIYEKFKNSGLDEDIIMNNSIIKYNIKIDNKHFGGLNKNIILNNSLIDIYSKREINKCNINGEKKISYENKCKSNQMSYFCL